MPGRTLATVIPPGRGPPRSPDATVLTAALTRTAATPLPTAAQGTASQRTQNDPSGITLPAIPTGPTQRQGGGDARS